MKKLLYLLFATTILLNSCAKDTFYLEAGEDTEGEGGTSLTSLEGTKWKIKSMVLGQEINGLKSEADLFLIAEACNKDDLILFNKGGIFIYDEGPTKCDVDDPQQETGKWSLSADKKKLNLASGSLNNSDEMVSYDFSGTANQISLTMKETVNMNVGGENINTIIYSVFTFTAVK
ncbi:MAG: DUF5004 domain-containing protein [Pedobacter sp.]